MPRQHREAPDPTRRSLLAGITAVSGGLLLTGGALVSSRPAFAMGSAMGNRKFDIDRFVAECIQANGETGPQSAVCEVLARAVANPGAVLAALGEPDQAGMNVLHRSPSLTIFAATWTPQMNLMPHNHRMWANIGIYTGREDNILWRRTDDGIEAHDAAALFAGDAVELPEDVIHSVTNPLLRFTGGIHIYGGDFFATARSHWDPETLDEQPSDGATIREMFERENQRYRPGNAG